MMNVVTEITVKKKKQQRSHTFREVFPFQKAECMVIGFSRDEAKTSIHPGEEKQIQFLKNWRECRKGEPVVYCTLQKKCKDQPFKNYMQRTLQRTF